MKFTAPIRTQLIEYRRLGHTVAKCAALVKIGRSTLNGWLEKGRKESQGQYYEFYLEFTQANALFENDLIGIVRDSASPKACLELLARSDKAWQASQKIEMVVNEEKTKLIEYLEQNISPDAFEEVLTALENYTDDQDIT